MTQGKFPTVCCEFCGRDTKNKSRICRHCTGGHQHTKENAGASMSSFEEYFDESDHDYSENALGPKQAEDRMGAIWLDEQSEWRRADTE